MFHSLRDFIERVQESGDCKVIENADWDLEIGALTEWASYEPDSPLLLFDRIKGYPPGYRVVSNVFNTTRRMALALGLPPDLRGADLVKALRDRLKRGVKPIPPSVVKDGPVMENVQTGDEIDLLKFPVPKWHELDGGRYIGTGSMTVTRDPDEGWVNFGAYRHQVLDKNTLGAYIVPGHHGDMIRQKYWAKGKSCPAAVVCGQDPMVWSAAGNLIPWGVSEYDYAGGYRGEPVEVVKGVTTDLPIPATAEIVIEGEMPPPDVEQRVEGPFGEAQGYYGLSLPRPVLRVKSVMHRNAPIILGNPPLLSVASCGVGLHLYKAATLWDELDRQLPGVTGTWFIPESTFRGMMVIALKQQYPGHAKQAALAAAGCLPTAYQFTYIIVVDEDIDPSNIAEVLWALGTRTEVEKSIDIVRGCWGTATDPMLTDEQIKNEELEHSTALILACKPYRRLKTFPASTKSSPELMKTVKTKWAGVFDK